MAGNEPAKGRQVVVFLVRYAAY